MPQAARRLHDRRAELGAITLGDRMGMLSNFFRRDPPVGVFGDFPEPVDNPYEMDLDLAARGIDSVKAGAEIGATTSVLLGGLLLKRWPADVLDYGGGLGSVYFRMCRIVPDNIRSWHVVELAAVCARGRQLQDGTLRFSTELPARADVVLLAGVLQYLNHPYAAISEILGLRPHIVVLDRTPVGARARHMVQRTWPHLGGHTLPWNILDRDGVAACFADYDLMLEQTSPHPGPDASDESCVARIYRRRAP